MTVEAPFPHSDALNTRRSLIDRLRNIENRDSWQEFFDTYWRLIYSVAREAGLTSQESEDVVQKTTVAVAKYIKDFRFLTWKVAAEHSLWRAASRFLLFAAAAPANQDHPGRNQDSGR
jgi:RNA polymerase sigma-70 factor (ECF subfamily)